MFEKGAVSVELEDLSSPLEDVEEEATWLAEGLYWLLYLVVPSAIPRSTLRAYGKISVYLSCIVVGFILPAPLVIFAQAKFFNAGQDCITQDQTDSDGCKQAMALVSQTSAVTNGLNSVLALWLSPVVGRLSDSIGRKMVLWISVVPLLARSLCLCLWAATDGAVTLWAYFVLSCCPSFILVAAQAFTADLIPGKHRATFFSFNSATFSVGSIWGSAIAGLIDRIVVSSFIATCVLLFAIVWVILMLDESLPEGERKPFDRSDSKQVREVCNFFSQMKIVNRNAVFRRLAMTLMFSSMCSQGLYQVQQLYFRQELDFTKDNFVTYSEISGAGGMVVQILLTPVLIEKAGEKSTVVIGLSVYVVYMLMYATELADTPSKAYANSLIQDISNVNVPAITAVKSTLSAGNEQGQIVGAITAIQNLAAGIGPFLFSAVFSVSLEDDAGFQPSMIWWLGILIMLFAVVLACTVPDPRLLQVAHYEQLAREKAGNSDLSESLVRAGGGEGAASLHEKARTPKPSILDSFYMWVANL